MALRQLYRQYLRQIRQLPVLYLREFFHLKARDDMGTVAKTKQPALLDRKLKRVRKDMRMVGGANKMNAKAFTQVLDLAYGRKGKLKWELLEPLLLNPCTHPPPAIIPSVRRSVPPAYSPELRALLTSPLSRTTKPLKPETLDRPPSLPARAGPTLEAKLLGNFSKRREVNIRWRYFTSEWRKILPPLSRKNDPSGKRSLAPLGTRLQNINVLEDIEGLIGPLEKPKDRTRKELRSHGTLQSLPNPSVAYHPSRWLRRRYQQLLGRIPILNYMPCRDLKSGNSHKVVAVALSPYASSPFLRPSVDCLSLATAADIRWLNTKK